MQKDLNKQILLVNARVRTDSSTLRLARRLLDRLGGTADEVNLEREGLLPLSYAALQERTQLLEAGDYGAPMLRYARQLAAAEEIVVAAPYWDLSFPSALKVYLEHTTVNGVTFSYGEDGRPIGPCRAKRLFYVMTAGGPVYEPDHGYTYVRDLAAGLYGIPQTHRFSVEMLDVVGMDAEGLLREAEYKIDEFFEN